MSLSPEGIRGMLDEYDTDRKTRMDLVIDYLGKRHIVELKVWRDKAYHEKGESQLAGYLDSYHLDKGYMLTYNFNKHKENGVKTVRIEGKELIEVFV